ncbi:MAG TPA: NAD(P)/FAD-dependent oxidoreductase, partial [Xanthomonadales bacterium]|nr:NAD(P)/FAD-dependent oxidoreductase [Xanthomonadales bacterium]
LPVPVELGGEFIHGTADVSFALLRAANTVAVDTGDTSFVYEDGELRDGKDPFAIVERVMARAKELTADVSVEEFLQQLRGDDAQVERERRYTRMLVEGFDAADPRLASTRALAEEWNGDDSGQTSRQFRPLGGYAHLFRTMYGALDPARVQVRLATPVHAVRWGRDGVSVSATTSSGAPLEVHARTAIVTLPVGVLQANTVRFEPALPQAKHDALAGLVMGPVVKLVMRFRSAFWERVRDGKYLDAAFFHRAEASFPTFWTLLPLRTPLLVGWAGGPKADALAGHDEAALTATALDDLVALFGSDTDPRGELEAAYTHDWQHDPYARGSYSYVAVGGANARTELGAAVDDVLFFAGEATASTSESGTAAGALQSGERAANEALRALAD